MPDIPSITILYAGLFGMMLLVLSLNIFREWVRVAISVQAENEYQPKRAQNAQASFIEFVSFCLILFFLIEIHGAPAVIMHGLGAGLLLARIMHALGVGDTRFAKALRVMGTQTTFLVLMIASLGAIYYALMPLLAHSA